MANGYVVALGIILLLIATYWFFYSIPNVGYTIPQAHNLCTSDWMQFALIYGTPEDRQACNNIEMMAFGIYGLIVIGIILIIVGAVKDSKKAKPPAQA